MKQFLGQDMRQYLTGLNVILALVCINSQAEELSELDFKVKTKRWDV